MTEDAEYQRIRLPQNHGPTLKFEGKRIAETEFETRGRDPLRMRLEIWETKKERCYVAVSTSFRIGEDQPLDARAVVVDHEEEELERRFAVMDFFAWEFRARTMVRKQLDWKLELDVD